MRSSVERKKSILARPLSLTGSSLDTAEAFIGQLILLLLVCERRRNPLVSVMQLNSSSIHAKQRDAATVIAET